MAENAVRVKVFWAGFMGWWGYGLKNVSPVAPKSPCPAMRGRPSFLISETKFGRIFSAHPRRKTCVFSEFARSSFVSVEAISRPSDAFKRHGWHNWPPHLQTSIVGSENGLFRFSHTFGRKLYFLPSKKLLAADGRGWSQLVPVRRGKYNLLPPTVAVYVST